MNLTLDDTLCQLCAQINLRLPTESHWKVLIREYAVDKDLDDSAKAGCALCRVIAESHRESHTFNEARIKHKLRSDQRTHDKIQSEAPANRYFPGRAVQNGPIAMAALSRAQGWLDECRREHPSCSSLDATRLPARVIDVAQGSGDRSFLYIPSPGVQSGDIRYAALSYCWGGPQSGRLTTANIHAKKKDIDVDSLGKTIKDAMEITRALGLRFLWVDSQCIIQDSTEDWQLESARMGSIYHNSEVTISASGGTHSDSGLLGPRETSRMAPVPLKFTAPDESVGTVLLRHDGMFGRVPYEPLDKRGWTLQEGLLSRRLLSFGRQQITWECRSGYKTENGALLQEQEHFLGLPRPIRKPQRYDPIPMPIPELLRHRSEAVLTWEFIVNAFTERTLSFSTDKLPALSGIAQHVQKTRPDDTYLIGMWKADLPWCLLWGVGAQAQRPPVYRAPSWSWASLEGRIVCFGDQDGWWGQDAHAHCVVEDVVVSPKGLNGYGEVCDGSLTIRGPLKEGWRMACRWHHDAESNVIYLFEDDRLLDPSERAFELKLGYCEMDVVDPSMVIDQPVSTWCLRVTDTDGLALLRQTDGTFRRLGVFGLDEERIQWFEDAMVERIVIL
ncbi:het-domain-containing protein [Fusarium mundagurra]|uniref:Het-domain-containing protein n=1 Tax=Fusarium mundagurra TaxID=1567541 RepID=A0A8H5YFA9_9HYPO|nr:het-domain-containing protein [Fusarium mundagurra]